ncbi:MAG: oligosaccharide flippase family protein, partial [Flavobacteriales bacterium]|jgi:O-antigen/teichoic acid export membrane protein|nr:oligosaccharide flippase family protein [Flavobacteriales bacterium]
VGWLQWFRAGGEAFRIEWFVMAQTGAYAVTLLVALGMALRLSGRVRVRWRPAFSFMVIRQSLPYALLILLMSFYYRADMLMLERLLPDGAVQAGIYAQGFRFFEAFNMLGYLLAALLLPLFSRMLRERDDVAPLALLAFRLVLAGAVAVAVFASLRAHAVMELRYSEHTDLSAPAFTVLMWSFVAVCVTYVFGSLLTARGDLRRLNIMAAVGAVANIGINLYVIPRWQVQGAAWAGLAVQAGTALAQMVLAARALGMPLPAKVLLRGLAHAAGLGALLFGLHTLHWPVLAELAVYVPAAVALAFITRLVSPADLRRGGAWVR